MREHNLFYYPYASFTNAQLPLLKVAALYFDKLFIVDPVGASWATIGADHHAREAVRLLKDAGILQTVTPADVLAQYTGPISDAIRRDMHDREFLDLCEGQSRASGKQRWTLSLAKVPHDLQTDQTMRHLMGDFARQASKDAGQYLEQIGAHPGAYYEFAEAGRTYDETNPGYGDIVEYRVLGQFSEFPLALGEAIMVNHALFAGLLHAGATPITDDAFRARTRQLKVDQLAATALTDRQLDLPVLSPELALAEVLEYRQKHDAELRQARDKLGWMARRIKAEPWSEDFAKELEHKTIPDIAKELDEARKARDAWLKSKRGRMVLGAAGVVTGAAAAVLAVFAAPLAPVALATAGLGLASGAAIPGAEWLLDWRDGKKSLQENGLHYLLRT